MKPSNIRHIKTFYGIVMPITHKALVVQEACSCIGHTDPLKGMRMVGRAIILLTYIT